MTPAEYLRTIVLPTLADLMDAPGDQRRAYLACITAAHLVDHVDVARGSLRDGKRDVRRAVRALDLHIAGCLDIVEAVATGVKHAKPDDRATRAVKFAPGHERHVRAFALDTPGAGLNEGRWGGPGLLVEHGGVHWFLDDTVRIVVRGFADAFPDLFASVDLEGASSLLSTEPSN